MALQLQRGGSSSSSASVLGEESLYQPDAANILYKMTFSRYKLGSPVLYMIKVEVSRVLPPLVGSGGEMQESRAAPLAFWTVKKRYSECQKFHESILKQFGDTLILPEFPPKTWTSNLFNSETAVQKRLRALQTYFDKVLMHSQIRGSIDLQNLLEVEVPEQLPSFRVCSFGIHSADQVFAVCEVSDGNTLAPTRESASREGGSGRPKTGKPVLFFHLMIRKILQLNFSSESSVFVREDLLENAGRSMRFNLVLGPPEHSYEISIGVSNYKGRNTSAALRIRVLAPSLEDILSEAGNSPQQVDELMKRICSASSRARSSEGPSENSARGSAAPPGGDSARRLSSKRKSARKSSRASSRPSSRPSSGYHNNQQQISSSRGGDRGDHYGNGNVGNGNDRNDRYENRSSGSSQGSSASSGVVARGEKVQRRSGRNSHASHASSYVGFGNQRNSQVSSAGFECHSDSD